eukprot:CAMPEP_0196594746 /NCGR_PEP_ID=MMETSP1081-20130531/79169_1 /TAXON_ID=36882 /ORGANISM="Pyramimonas amylifera, Strain CCMP720" /LENGTH=120 /DNA_ID=CAMNT_0041919093 /DNA_START=141 /DNA_END=503 /DNA_ORIENTATION=-
MAARMVFQADLAPQKLYHATSIAAGALLPLGIMTSPGSLTSMPVDLALGVALPIHSHIAMNYVISDYAQKISKAPAFAGGLRFALLGLTTVTFLGLTKLNLSGQGVSETLKQMWRPQEKA